MNSTMHAGICQLGEGKFPYLVEKDKSWLHFVEGFVMMLEIMRTIDGG